MSGSNVEFAERFDRVATIFRGWQEQKHYLLASEPGELLLNFTSPQICAVTNNNNKCEFRVGPKLVLPQRTGVFLIKRDKSDEVDFLVFDNYINVEGRQVADANYKPREAADPTKPLFASKTGRGQAAFQSSRFDTVYGQMQMPSDAVPNDVFDLPTVCHDPDNVMVAVNDNPKSEFENMVNARIQSSHKGTISYPSYAPGPRSSSSSSSSSQKTPSTGIKRSFEPKPQSQQRGAETRQQSTKQSSSYFTPKSSAPPPQEQPTTGGTIRKTPPAPLPVAANKKQRIQIATVTTTLPAQQSIPTLNLSAAQTSPLPNGNYSADMNRVSESISSSSDIITKLTTATPGAWAFVRNGILTNFAGDNLNSPFDFFNGEMNGMPVTPDDMALFNHYYKNGIINRMMTPP